MSRAKIKEVHTPKHTTLQVPPAVKSVLKSIQLDRYNEAVESGHDAHTQPMGQIMAEALAEKFPDYAETLRKAGLID